MVVGWLADGLVRLVASPTGTVKVDNFPCPVTRNSRPRRPKTRWPPLPYLTTRHAGSGLQRHSGTHRASQSSLSRSLPRSAGSRTRFVVDLPACQLGPGWRKRAV